jgi:hypothetical protein
LTIGPAFDDDAALFSLWSLPGGKSLVHDGRRLVVRTHLGRRDLRIALAPSLADGDPFAYAVPAGPRGRRGLQAAIEVDLALAGDGRPPKPCVTRGDFVHMRALQALDAERDGASEREIATLVFGTAHTPEGWNDSALRANVRYLLNHGRAMRDGGYRDLLFPKPQKRKAVDP